ncbi:DUF1071 domain-containing protein [Paenibacillus xylanexedens]|uniref:Sak single strand annealing protein n=1 Tax=Paenibacillus xylanexedens TaxID=528191 RepID=UPI000F546AE9|nr:DUF1071 domain-containing protein [Paenibacillus xylanexedens]RPK20008.1 hypothetical protein EDO6_06525 [Paenibacillus xylanexedens]
MTTATAEMNYFAELAKNDVSKYVEKKGKFSYLSWTYAIQTLKKAHPDATWETKRDEKGQPFFKTECGFFVEVAVTVEGITHSQIHPVLDNNNRPIAQPNAFQINTSIQRCLVKAIALHGLGLYIYAGEDLPELDDEGATTPSAPATPAPNAREEARARAQAKVAEKRAAETNATQPSSDGLPFDEQATGTNEPAGASATATGTASDTAEPINENQIKAIGNMLNILVRKKPDLNKDEFVGAIVTRYGKSALEELTFEQGKEVVVVINGEMRK